MTTGQLADRYCQWFQSSSTMTQSTTGFTFTPCVGSFTSPWHRHFRVSSERYRHMWHINEIAYVSKRRNSENQVLTSFSFKLIDVKVHYSCTCQFHTVEHSSSSVYDMRYIDKNPIRLALYLLQPPFNRYINNGLYCKQNSPVIRPHFV